MKIKKSEVNKVLKLVSDFRAQGAPYWILLHEAHKLTGGAVGVPFSHSKQDNYIHLSEVAVKLVRNK
jgi:L-amino acid N-acyltransferase YncA